MRTAFAVASIQLAALAWTLAILVDTSPLETAPALLVGLGLLAMSTVAMVGMIAVGGRWAHRLGLIAIASMVALAIIRPIDLFWGVAVGLTALSSMALLSPVVTRSIRRLPSASGPPPRAITPPLILLATPAVLGFLGNAAAPWALLVVGIAAPNVAWLYSRVLPGGLLAIRMIWPALAIALAPWMGWWAGTASVVMAAAVAVLSWHKSVKASYHPPREVGTAYPIPPELTPKEVLDAAEIDDRGRRK
ncbi:MAG TPA: hypothetical protein VF115_15405 [Acidimicrobiia bacterium]